MRRLAFQFVFTLAGWSAWALPTGPRVALAGVSAEVMAGFGSTPGGLGCSPPIDLPVSSTTSVSMCARTIIINARALGTQPFTYGFRKNGAAIVPGPTGNVDANGVASMYTIDAVGAPSQLRVINANPADAGVYEVVISNACGSIATSPRFVSAVPQTGFDTCETARQTTGPGPFSFEMCGAYVNQSPASCAGTQRADVWMRYTPLFTGNARISTCDGPNVDTILSVYSTCGGAELACSDQFCGLRASVERIQVVAGVVIFVRLAVGAAVPAAPVRISVEQLAAPCPADLSGDGVLDPDDLADFITLFFANPAGAGSDFNGDGVTDPDDLADYLSSYFIGC